MKDNENDKKSFREMTLLEYINSEPRGFFLPDMAVNGLYLIHKNAYDVYNSPKLQLELAKVMDSTFTADFTYSLCDGILFSEVLGQKILKYDKDFPSVLEHNILEMEDLENLKMPDFEKNTRLRNNIETHKLISKNIDKPMYTSIQGPFTLAVQLAGATNLLGKLITDVEFVEKLLKFTTDLIRKFALKLQEAGAQLISIAEPATVTLNRERFQKYVVDNLNTIYDEIHVWKSLHICGDTRDFLDLMLKCHIDAISLDQILDFNEIMPQIPESIVLIGNLDPVELLENESPETIRRQTLKLLKDMRPYNNYLCDFGCDCTNDTPVENLQSAIRAGRISYEELDKISLDA